MASKAKAKSKAKRSGAAIAPQRPGAAIAPQRLDVEAPARPKAGSAQERRGLRKLSAKRTERAFKPTTSVALALTVFALSVGAVAAGAGVYGILFGAPGTLSQKYAPFLLVGGTLVVLVLSFFGKQVPAPLRVGDDGLAIEKSATEVERIPWRSMTRVTVAADGVRVEAGDRVIVVPASEHLLAAARLAAEARARIPKRVLGPEGALPAPASDQGALVDLDPPQIAGATCAKSGRAIVLEDDARLCGRCGEIYHRASAPPACVGCGARLL